MYIHVPVAASFHPPSKEEMAGGREKTTTILLASRPIRTNNRPVTCRLLARVRLLHILAQLWGEHCCHTREHCACFACCIHVDVHLAPIFRRYALPSTWEQPWIHSESHWNYDDTTIVCSALIVFHFWARWSIYRSIFVTSGSSQVMEHIHPLCGLITW